MSGDALYAWTTVLPGGAGFSLIGAHIPGLAAHVPLIGFNRDTMERYKDLARDHGRLHRQSVFFVRFDAMHILESAHFTEPDA